MRRMLADLPGSQRTKKKAQAVDLLGPFGLSRTLLDAYLVAEHGTEPASTFCVR